MWNLKSNLKKKTQILKIPNTISNLTAKLK